MTNYQPNPTNPSNLVTLVLRDSARTEALRTQIRKENGRAIPLPLFAFNTVFDCPAAIDLLRNPRGYDKLLFVSPQGVQALGQLAKRKNLPLPADLPCAAPGAGSRSVLLAAGFSNVVTPPGVGDVDYILKNRMLKDLRNKRVAVVQRVDALPRVVKLLRQQGAVPIAVQCYERVRQPGNIWQRLDGEVRASVNSIIAYDAASLEVLLELAEENQERIKSMPICVIHPNIGKKAAAIGYQNIIVSGDGKDMILGLTKLVKDERYRFQGDSTAPAGNGTDAIQAT